jgi:DNA-binding response OmpR family regulator
VPAALVVERDAVLRNIVRTALTSQGFEAMDAVNAAEADALCALLVDPPIDLLILDHVLLAANAWLDNRLFVAKLLELLPVLKVLVISDCSYEVVAREDGLPSGAWFLQKPFTAAQFLEAVKNLLQPRIQ